MALFVTLRRLPPVRPTIPHKKKANMEKIEVAVSFPVHGTYTYGVPEGLSALVCPGKRVMVPFGKRRITGYVLGRDTREVDCDRLKPIDDVLDETPVFPESMVPFFRWVAAYYVHPVGDVICEALPGGINPLENAVYELAGEPIPADGLCDNPVQEQVLCALQNKPLRAAQIARKTGCDIPAGLLLKMEKKGWIQKHRQVFGPRARTRTRRYAKPADQPVDPAGLSEPKRRILSLLAENGEMAVDHLKAEVPRASDHLRELSRKNMVEILENPVYRDPFGEAVEPDSPPELTTEQRRVVREVTHAMKSGFSAFLLAGVTGSGKTEVYMHLATRAINEGRGVIVLVPEIALISEVERRFRARFGQDVAVLHSGLSAGEKLDQWMRIAKGDCRVAIGARSAIFTPLADPGLIIVDEEHDFSYKQESRLHYNARDLAVVRARHSGAVVLLGSATPSVQSIANVASRKFREINLTRRIHSRALPAVRVVDLRQQKEQRGTARFITAELKESIQNTLSRSEQVLLFLNRRGFASHPVCARCGEPQKCRNCDVTLTLHKKSNIYKCHMCGYFRAATSRCSHCGSDAIKALGMGTEKIETALKSLFPQARIARMDRDTTARKGALVKILKGLKNREIDILVGTQMVAKGHDFPGITLVGIICADLSLSFPDFRAGETTFQVLAQVAGRAGRGASPGSVILQTYNPGHFAIVSAQKQDFMEFYNQEIRFRRAIGYPPFSRMLQLKISGKDKDKTRIHAEATGRLCRQILASGDEKCRAVEVMGPIEAPLSRVAGRYRWQVLMKASSSAELQHFIRRLCFENSTHFGSRDVSTAIDVDPMSMM